jgi:hypothetical protein
VEGGRPEGRIRGWMGGILVCNMIGGADWYVYCCRVILGGKMEG